MASLNPPLHFAGQLVVEPGGERPMISATVQARRCRDLGPLGEVRTALTEQECTGGGVEVLIEAESFAATKSEKVLYAGSLALEQAEIENPNSKINQHRQPT